MCDNCDNTRSFLKGAILGAAAGAVLGILFAPESGEETRKKIKSESLKLKAKGIEVLEEAKDKIQDAEDKIDELKGSDKPMLEEAAGNIRDEGEKIEKNIADTAERIGEKAKYLKNKYFKGTK